MNTTDRLNGQDLAQQLSTVASELKIELKESTKVLGEYIAERISHLKFAIKEPGYDEAFQAERDSIALRASGLSVDEADKVDEMVVHIVTEGLTAAVAAI